MENCRQMHGQSQVRFVPAPLATPRGTNFRGRAGRRLRRLVATSGRLGVKYDGTNTPELQAEWQTSMPFPLTQFCGPTSAALHMQLHVELNLSMNETTFENMTA